MAVLSGATASGKQMYSGQPGTALATIYTAPNASANVTSPSSTAYIKEIIICNPTASAVTVTVAVGSAAIVGGTSIAANDSKVLSGLNTMLNAGQSVQASASTASSVWLTISGTEVQ